MKKKWREFEKLVSRIEKLLSPQGAVVKTPDRLIDKITGQIREVDASIRLTVGSLQVLITIECRDSKKISDDTWIEQLVTKKQKIGASNTIAVSSTKFSKSAIETSRLHGIELRLIKNISDEDILSWIGRIKFENHIGKVALDGVRVKVYDNDPDAPLDPTITQALKEDKLQAKIFFSENDNIKVSIADVLDFFSRVYNASRGFNERMVNSEKIILTPGESFSFELQPSIMHLFDDVPENGIGILKTFSFELGNGGLSIETVKGPRYIKKLEIDLALAKVVEEIPVSRKVNYSTMENPIANVVETDVGLFRYDQKEDYILSYKVPKEENAPVEFLLSDMEKENKSNPN